MTITAAVAVTITAAAVTVAAAIVLSYRNYLTAAVADGAAGVAADSATAAFQHLRHQRQDDIPAAAHTWICWDRAAAAGAASSLSPFSLLFYSFALVEIPLPFQFPSDLRLKLALLVDTWKPLLQYRHLELEFGPAVHLHLPEPNPSDGMLCCIRRPQSCFSKSNNLLKLLRRLLNFGSLVSSNLHSSLTSCSFKHPRDVT